MDQNDEDLRDALTMSLQAHQALQRLTIRLERRGLLSSAELAYVWDEGPEPPISTPETAAAPEETL